jgi:hypothetical protein
MLPRLPQGFQYVFSKIRGWVDACLFISLLHRGQHKEQNRHSYILDQGEIQKKIREIQIKNIFCLDCRPKKFKTGEIQTKIRENQL